MFNQFVFDLNNRLQTLEPKKRQRIIERILKDLSHTDVFTPLHKMTSDLDYLDDDNDNKNNITFDALENDRELRISKLQEKYNIKPDKQTKEILEREKVVRTRCGRTDLHDAVSMGDLGLIRKLVVEDKIDPSIKDNNGHTAVHIAVLEQNSEVIELLKELNCINNG